MTNRNGPTSLLFIGFLSFAIIGVPSGALGVAWIHIQETFGLGLDALGILLTTTTIGRLITAFLSGRLVGSIGVGRFLLIGSVTGMVGMLGFTLSPVWPVLLAAYFLVGLGSGVIDAGINTFVAAHYSTSRLNWLHACFGIGLTVGPALVTLIVIDAGLSWRWSYLLLVILQGMLAVTFALTQPRWRVRPHDASGEVEAPAAAMSDTLKLGMIWLSLAMFFFYGGAEIGTGQLLNSLMVEGRGVDPKTAGFWVSIYWGSFTVGRMLIGLVIDRIGPRVLLRISMLGTVVGALLIWWNPVIQVTFLGLSLMGLSLAPMFPTLVAITPDRVGIAHTPNAIGFQIGFAGLGAALLVGFAGAWAETAGREVIAPFLVIVSLATLLLHEAILWRESRRAAVLA